MPYPEITLAESLDRFKRACGEATGALYEFAVALGQAASDALGLNLDPDAWLRDLPAVDRERLLRSYAAILNRGRPRKIGWRRLDRPQRRAALVLYVQR
jgi:hypothetical protein